MTARSASLSSMRWKQHRVRQGQNGRSALPAHGLERAVEPRGTSHLQDLKLHPKRPMAVAQTLQGERMPRVVRIRQHGVRETRGTTFLRSSSCLMLRSMLSEVTPVMFPPGASRLATRPS